MLNPQLYVELAGKNYDKVDGGYFTTNNANGEKKSKAINLDKFEQGAKWSGLSDAIDLEYYGIVWSKDTKNYIYRYWDENDVRYG